MTVDESTAGWPDAPVMEKERRAAVQRAFGDRIRMLRRRLGVSQDEFALRSGLHRTYIGAVERGECNISLINMLRIAATLEVPPAELLEDPGLDQAASVAGSPAASR